MLARRAAGALLLITTLTAPGVRPVFAAPPEASAPPPPPAASASVAASASAPVPAAAPVPVAASASAPVPAPVPVAASASAPVPVLAAAPAATAQGAIVVAVTDDAAVAARPLAQEIYRDPALRPAIDEASARVLAGSPPPAGAPVKLKELAELRGALARAQEPVVARGLLASLGATLGAQLVIAVSMEGGRPVAKVLRASSVSYERIELGATVETAPDGQRLYRWPGVAATLKGFLPKVATAPLAPLADSAAANATKKLPAKDEKPFWKSPWFWGPIGGLAAAGLAVLIASQVASKNSDIHLGGTVAP